MKKILVLAANPQATTRLRLDQEVRDIENGLSRAQHRDDFRLVHKSAVRPRDIQRAMLDETPQIVHFSGHGEGEEGLVFEDNVGNAKFVSGEALAALFELFESEVECVLLNGCYSKFQAEAIVEHIDYVIGMRQAISDVAAIEFAVAFYDALGAGRSYEFAYKLGCNAIQLNASPDQKSTRKFTSIDIAGEFTSEYPIPVLLKNSALLKELDSNSVTAEANEIYQEQAQKEALEANLSAVESAGQARIESLNRRIFEEESKLYATTKFHTRQALKWLKRNEKNLPLDAKNYAVSKHLHFFEGLSAEEQDDFRWEIEKYIESVYFSILSNTFDLLDEPVIIPSINSSKAYQSAFFFIKDKIPLSFRKETRNLLFEHFDYLLTRLFIVEDIEFSKINIKANQYREQVREYLEDHKLANYEKVLLEELRQEIELSIEEAKSILSEEYAPILAAQQAYRNRLNGLIQGGFYPFSDDINAELKKIQKRRNLTDKEVAEISRPIFELAEKEYQDKQAQQT